MPWKEKTIMSTRQEFIAKAISKEVSFSQLCREYNITRNTGYKWLNRYLNSESLDDRSKAPFNSPNKTPEYTEQLILSARDSHPAWGPRKLHKFLENAGHDNLPAPSTIAGILKRNDKISPEESIKHTPYKRFEYEKPNQLWQLDFKGDFAMLNGQRCYPLTVLDDHSRYSIAVDAKENQKSHGVFETFYRIFKEYGLPNAILSDNGVPWKDNKNGYTPFEIYLMQLNILPIHGRIYHPQTQGKEERFHRTMKEELLRYKVIKDLTHAQQCFDTWRQEYNNERPHNALNLDVPAKRYKESKNTLPSTIKDPDYDTGVTLRKVNCKGYISINKHRYYLSESFIGRFIRILHTEDESLIKLCYGNFEIAKIDIREKEFLSRKIYRLTQQ
jgi:transposase InsO family protein